MTLTLRTADTTKDQFRRTTPDASGSAKPPENRTLGSGEVLTTSIAVNLTPTARGGEQQYEAQECDP
jgi:hypothetical protein